MSLQDELSELYSRVPRGMRLGLTAMSEAAVLFSNPERAFPAVHIAGTNGKGSTTALVEAMARASGLRTGRYTSPHLARFAERIAIDGEPIADDALREVLHEVNTGAPDLSFFETATLAAFVAFRRSEVDLAIVEVGIGGRLDATNILPSPRATAITRIALDHTDRLGRTLVDIAYEKAGIAKSGVPLVVGPVEGDARAEIERVARAAGAPVVSTAPHPLEDRVALPGLHQRENARVAIAIAELLGLSSSDIAKGLEGVRWPGRLESLALEGGSVLLDAAHNVDGIEALLAHLAKTEKETPLALVFGALADKDGETMLDRLAARFSRRVYVAPKGRAATPPGALSRRHPGVTAATLPDALRLAREMVGTGGLVVVAGSIYLVGEARAHLLNLPTDPPVAL